MIIWEKPGFSLGEKVEVLPEGMERESMSKGLKEPSEGLLRGMEGRWGGQLSGENTGVRRLAGWRQLQFGQCI